MKGRRKEMHLESADRRFANERGQGATEYLALIILVALVCIPVVKLLPKAVQGYVRPFYYSVSRPLP